MVDEDRENEGAYGVVGLVMLFGGRFCAGVRGSEKVELRDRVAGGVLGLESVPLNLKLGSRSFKLTFK